MRLDVRAGSLQDLFGSARDDQHRLDRRLGDAPVVQDPSWILLDRLAELVVPIDAVDEIGDPVALLRRRVPKIVQAGASQRGERIDLQGARELDVLPHSLDELCDLRLTRHRTTPFVTKASITRRTRGPASSVARLLRRRLRLLLGRLARGSAREVRLQAKDRLRMEL